MIDTFGEGKSPQMVGNENEKKSRLVPRPGPGEKNLIPVVPGPCASRILGSIFFSCKKFCIVSLTFLFLLCLNVTVNAVPDYKTELAFELPCTGVMDTGGVFFMNDYFLIRYPYRNISGLSNAANVDWTAAQDFKYKYLENVLYNYLGGSYEPCTIGCPFRPEKKRYTIIRNINPDDGKYPYVSGKPGDLSNSCDIYSSLIFSSQYLRSSSMCFIEPETILLDVCVVPEPSSIFLFAVTAFGVLMMKNKKYLERRLTR